MINRHFVYELATEARPMFIDITKPICSFVAESGLRDGLLTTYSEHTSCGVLIQEESEDVTYLGTQYVLQDTLNALQKIVPPVRHEGQYLHPGPIHITNAAELRGERPEWGLNTDAHIITSLLGRSVVVPVIDGAVVLGEFGRIYFADLDATRGRQRAVRAHVLGE
jgi:secondary thiamine-phosphate synthase enzyme